jgi:hypothetical protein
VTSFFKNYAPSAAGQNTGIDLSLAVGSPQIGGGQNALGVPLTDTTGARYKYDVGAHSLKRRVRNVER